MIKSEFERRRIKTDVVVCFKKVWRKGLYVESENRNRQLINNEIRVGQECQKMHLRHPSIITYQ